ncbi:MAG: DUF3306 domain-containing protein [Magnetospirillum sp.]|nr:DUF3306 domain-containing protein [Magnetospirillum sp.]
MTEPFLSRWSRRKHDAKAATQPEPEAQPTPPPEAAEAAPPPDLPPIETLDRNSDYSAFLKAGVPADIRDAALQKLWASDSSLMAPEIMDLHMGDYTSPVAEVVKTAWRLGKGVLDAAELAAEGEAGDQQGDAPPPAGSDADIC